MKVFRLCAKDELEVILNEKHFLNVGHKCEICPRKNTHNYIPDKKYLHFFESEANLLYLFPTESTFICVYDIPEGILNQAKGIGFYLDFINFTKPHQITEYAIENNKIDFKYLKKVYAVKSSLDFDYVPSSEELYANLDIVYSS